MQRIARGTVNGDVMRERVIEPGISFTTSLCTRFAVAVPRGKRTPERQGRECRSEAAVTWNPAPDMRDQPDSAITLWAEVPVSLCPSRGFLGAVL